MLLRLVFCSIFVASVGQDFIGDLSRRFGLNGQGPGGPGFGPGGPGGPGFGPHRGPGGPGFGRGGFGPQNGPGGQPMDLGAMLNNVAQSANQMFNAPPPNSDIPPHIYRRLVRFCTRNPGHPKCQGHPEWINNQGGGNLLEALPGIAGRLTEAFPELVHFKLPPIPRINLPDVLRGVPDILRNVVPPSILGQLTEIARNTIKASCATSRTCKQQRPEILNQRASIAEQESAIHKVFNKNKAQEDIDRNIETRLARTHQVKQALLKKAGLDKDVEPENDGTFQKDILLTETQANTMLAEIDAAGNEVPTVPGAAPTGRGTRRGRSALFLETTPTQRWPNDRPIQYMFDQTLNEQDKGAVRAAIQEIETKTCVRFKFETTKPSNSHIYYVKTASSTVCGLSYIGRVEPVNTIYLTFGCGNPTGVAIHETLHALGLNHEQLRGDRDQFITINWANVNPQNYDFFAIADSKQFTSYGVKYDYGSIMHYNQFIASQFPTKPSMTAKVDPAKNNALMGQRNGLSARDIELVTKMYCVPQCEDKNVYCGAWALLDLCNSPNNGGYLQQNCKKSCSLC
uniref:Metalloendopeptidase n=1 Tax=Panagrellus redivivus TaxID=6233 RepID=A0A7E4W3Z8_PANRE